MPIKSTTSSVVPSLDPNPIWNVGQERESARVIQCTEMGFFLASLWKKNLVLHPKYKMPRHQVKIITQKNGQYDSKRRAGNF
jgi:hypothetical protein